jgi:hypothetical protein
MWKRLKRLWTKGQGQPDYAALDGPMLDGDPADTGVRTADGRPSQQWPVPIDDPLVERLKDYDQIARTNPEGASQTLRELMLESPTDARVLRRAAALMGVLAKDDEGMAELSHLFERAARTSQEGPLSELSEVFFAMDDFGLALAFADGAASRGLPEGRDARGLLLGAIALARTAQHQAVLERLAPLIGPSPAHRPPDDAYDDEAFRLGARVRYSISALLVGATSRLVSLRGQLSDAEPWISEIASRARAFAPSGPDASAALEDDPSHGASGEEELESDQAQDDAAQEPGTGAGHGGADAPNAGDARQRLLFLLYGSILLDDAENERLGASRLARWMHAVAAIITQTMPSTTRPAWVSPRGEVLARWLGNLLPERAAMPFSARLPRQSVVVVLADDKDLATLVESVSSNEAFPIFQAVKDPAEVGSPMADLIGVFRGDVELPFEPLDAERAADRVTPRMLALQLQDESDKAGRVGADELEGFLAWFASRRAHFELGSPRSLAERIPLDPARL